MDQDQNDSINLLPVKHLNVFLSDPVSTRLKMTKTQFPTGKIGHNFSHVWVWAGPTAIYYRENGENWIISASLVKNMTI